LNYLKEKGFKRTRQREAILAKFLSSEGHISTDELYSAVRKNCPRVGYSTVFRTLRLLKDAQLASEVNFSEKRKRFEHKFAHEHHDHLVCLKCGACIEVLDNRIEKLQEKLARRHGFKPVKHRMEIFGVCRNCK
jgi:Fur family ferric uptake transcriptional regulator